MAADETVEDYLTTLVTGAAEEYGYRWTVVAPDALELTGSAGRQIQLALRTLRRSVEFEPVAEWPALAADYVATALAAVEAGIESPVDVFDFGIAAPLLRTRLYTTNFDELASYIARPVAPGLAQMAVLDFPITVVLPKREVAAGWPVPEDEVFALAEANTRRDATLRVEWFDDGVRIAALVGADEYASSHALWLDHYPVTGVAGALFTVPAEGIMHAHPLDSAENAVAAVIRLAKLADALYTQLPHRISPRLYLWRDGRIHLAADIVTGRNRVEVRYSPDLVAALSTL